MRKLLVGGFVVAYLAAGQTGASAAWILVGSGNASARGQSMPAGDTPTVEVSGRNVTVSWPASTLPGGAVVAGYRVKRYDATSGASQSLGSDCSGTVSGLSCTEAAVPSGTWRYTVTPVQGQWVGGESSLSQGVTVASPALTLSPTLVTALPATLEGEVANFITGETVAFKLDDPATGFELSGTAAPSPIAMDGRAFVTLTIPSGTTNGSHTVYAVGSGGSVAGAGIAVLVVAGDMEAPSVSATVIGKTQAGTPGFIRQGGTYFVYANVTDGGFPPSGVATVTADVSSITPSGSSVSLSAGSFAVGGVTYNYRTGALTAKSPLSAGSYLYTIVSTDNAGNSQTQGGFTVAVDNTPPTGADVQTTNVPGGTAGKAETGDTVVFTYSETIDPNSVLAGWTGGSTAVTVRIIDGTGGTRDRLQVWNAGNSSQLPLGTIDLGRTDFVTGNASVTFTGSTMVQSGPTITVSLGVPLGVTATAGGTGTMTWSPSATATDAAANSCSTATITESGPSDRDF